jgi:hypothetical protein
MLLPQLNVRYNKSTDATEEGVIVDKVDEFEVLDWVVDDDVVDLDDARVEYCTVMTAARISKSSAQPYVAKLKSEKSKISNTKKLERENWKLETMEEGTRVPLIQV